MSGSGSASDESAGGAAGAGQGAGPLAGRRVVVTRPAAQAGPLVDLLVAAGAIAVVTPLIEISEEPEALRVLGETDITDFEWIVVTSRSAALCLVAAHGDLLGDRQRDAARPAVAAIGTVSARAIGSCQLVPAVQSAAGMLAEMPPPQRSGTVLVVQAVDAAPTLVVGLRAAQWEVVVNAPYRSVPARPSAAQQLAALSADAVLFASGSAARGWVDVFGTTTPPIVVAIGPETAAAAVAAGLQVTATAADHSLPGLVAELGRAVT